MLLKVQLTAAHPRVSGENSGPGPRPLRTPGSSPRERGKRTIGIKTRLPDRLIPA